MRRGKQGGVLPRRFRCPARDRALRCGSICPRATGRHSHGWHCSLPVNSGASLEAVRPPPRPSALTTLPSPQCSACWRAGRRRAGRPLTARAARRRSHRSRTPERAWPRAAGPGQLDYPSWSGPCTPSGAVTTCAPDGYPQAPYSRVVILLRVSGENNPQRPCFRWLSHCDRGRKPSPRRAGDSGAKRLSYSPGQTATNAATPTPRSLRHNPRAPDSPARR